MDDRLCPFCGLPVDPKGTRQICTPVRCPMWTTEAVYRKGQGWVPVDADGQVL